MATGYFYTFGKRKNSTATPTGTGTSIDLQLKSGTSLISPTFLIENAGRPTFDYISFEGRYYFVNDCISVRNNLWEIECTVDVLGTYKMEIGSTTALILYASGGRNDLIDTRIPPESDITISKNVASITGFSIYDDRMASVIISLTGTGSFGTYLLEYAGDVKELLRNAKREAVSSITDVVTGLQQLSASGSAADCLKGAIALPIAFNANQVSSMTAAADLYLGDYPCTDANFRAIKGWYIDDPIVMGDASVAIPWVNSGWMKHSPYTELYLYIPFIGTMRLPVDDLINDTSIGIDYSVNVTSGDVSVAVYGEQSSVIFATASGNIAMSTPYGSSNISGAKVTSAIISGAGGIAAAAAMTNPASAMAAIGIGLATSAAQMIGAFHGESYGGGGLGGGSSQGLSHSVHITSVSKTLSDTPINLDSVIGKPVMKKALIGSYSGFIQTDGCQISGDMYDQERDAINRLCDGGIYYE